MGADEYAWATSKAVWLGGRERVFMRYTLTLPHLKVHPPRTPRHLANCPAESVPQSLQ
jgi:hypothetical protein